jgi:glutamine amidotransferase
MSAVAIIDYRLCNLDSIARAIQECGGRPLVTRDPRDLAGAERIILPGVGAFGAAMANLQADGFDAALPDAVLRQGKPLLGICLGMHLLAEQGTEGGEHAGLGLLRGRVVKLNGGSGQRVPHIGWNDVTCVAEAPLFQGLQRGSDFYFVHSFRLESPAEETLATIDYCGTTVAAAGRGHIQAVQFHPEKSQTAGFHLLRNFLSLAC